MSVNQSLNVGERVDRFVAITVVLLSLVVCIISLIGALGWINKPFPGFLFYKNLVVTDISHNIGRKVNLKRVSDRIVEVNGKEVSSPEDIYRVIDGSPVGTLVDYRISRDYGSIELSIPTMKFTLGNFLFLFGVIYTVGLIFLVVGACVYFLKPCLYSSKVFFIFCSLVGLWFVTSFHSQSTYLFNLLDKLAFVGFIYCPVFGIYLAFIFPSSSLFLGKKHYIVFLIAFVFSTFLFISNFIYFDSYNIWKGIYSLTWLYLVLGSLMLPVSSVITYFKESSALEKQRAQVILLGSFLGLFLPALGGISIVVFKANIPFNLLALPVVFFPISIAYAIVKHKLFDIDVIIQKALVYGVLTGVVVGISVLMVLGFNVLFANYGGWRSPVFFAILSAFLVIALNPFKARIQNLIDSTFFRAKYDYRRTIEEMSFAMTSLLNIDEIASKIISTIERTMFSNSVSIILFDQNSGDYRVYAGSEGVYGTYSIKEDSELITSLKRYRQEIFKEDLIADERYMKYRDTLMRFFNDFNAALFIPMFFKRELIGILSLGEKRSGLSYNSQDIKLLRILANQSAIAIENAFAFKLVEDYARKLEEANRGLREAQAQLIQAEKMSAIGHLAAGIAHEIRNPLNIIEGARYYLSQIIDGENSEQAREYLDYIKHEIDRTNRLIDNLLNFSRSEPPHFEPLNINSILENALVLIRKQLSDNGIRLITNLSPDVPRIMGDPNQLWQVFINILMNAIQSMPYGSGELQIDTGLYNGSSDRVFISFKDTGVGIDEEDLPKIFDPFFTKKDTGTGLGLSISYKIIESHEGRIIASSEKGKGTTFIVELPINHTFEGEKDERK